MAFILGGSPHFRSLLGYPQEGGQRQRDGWCWWRWRRRGLPPSHWEHFRAGVCLPHQTGSTSGPGYASPVTLGALQCWLCLPRHTGNTSALAVPPHQTGDSPVRGGGEAVPPPSDYQKLLAQGAAPFFFPSPSHLLFPSPPFLRPPCGSPSPLS